jgi:hypothetical protein
MPVGVEYLVGVQQAGDSGEGFAGKQFEKWGQILGTDALRG